MYALSFSGEYMKHPFIPNRPIRAKTPEQPEDYRIITGRDTEVITHLRDIGYIVKWATEGTICWTYDPTIKQFLEAIERGKSGVVQ